MTIHNPEVVIPHRDLPRRMLAAVEDRVRLYKSGESGNAQRRARARRAGDGQLAGGSEMSSKERRAQSEAAAQARYEENRREEARKEALTMWERIEEADASADVKEILHRLAQHVGLES